MKNKLYKKLILVAICLVIIIAGTVVKLIKGMNYQLKWKKTKSIVLYLDNAQKNDLDLIVKEAFPGKDFIIQNLEEDDEFLVTIDYINISYNEMNSFVDKLNEKYNMDLTVEDLEIRVNNNVLLLDVVKPYLIPILITVIVVSVYFILRYKKIGAIKIIENLIYGIVMPQWVYFAILALSRLPVGYYTLPISILIYLISIITLIYIFEKQNLNVSYENSKNKK